MNNSFVGYIKIFLNVLERLAIRNVSESFEWRIRQRSRYGSRFSASELRHFKAKPRFCLKAVKRESSKKRGGAAENCFIFT